MSTRLVIWLAALVVAAGLLAELLLDPPNGDERLHLLVILAAPAVVTAALVPLLRRWVSRRASVAGAALMVGVCSLAIGAATTSAASNAMFLSDHDFRLFLVVLLLSCGLALLVGVQLSAPMARDIARLGDVAEAVAGGDLTVRTAITRRDEVGRTAAALDSMVDALRAAAEERARLADARQMLFTSVGHDLRTPLAAMRAAVESLQDGVATDPDRYLGVIGSELHNVEALLDQLTAFARIESGAPLGPQEAVAVAEVADEAVEALGPLAERRGVRLVLEADGPGTVRATVLDVSRCLRNLVENAISHSPDGGTVRVAVAPLADAGRPGVEVRVLDEGPGFPPEFRERAFEPFTRADPAR
ncbi:MAG: HAMP domain-containing histidine kinase, partial [Ilumatobacter sp.]|nr:HAMP domain-containing histidine kinase [Ilumatobacter sp.]